MLVEYVKSLKMWEWISFVTLALVITTLIVSIVEGDWKMAMLAFAFMCFWASERL
jgi:hypothetical protein